MEKIRRYVSDEDGVFEDADGNYVKHADHIAAVEKLEALLREWRRVERIWSLMGRSQSRESFDSLNGLCKRTDAVLAVADNVTSCPECCNGDLTVGPVTLTGTRNNEDFQVTVTGVKCDKCGYQTVLNSQSGEFTKAVSDAYRRKHELLLMPAERVTVVGTTVKLDGEVRGVFIFASDAEDYAVLIRKELAPVGEESDGRSKTCPVNGRH